LALVGLCGYAGSAMACPAVPGAWSAAPVGGGASALAFVAGGYDATACRMQSTLANNGAAHAQVQDNSPTAETRYRAQFIFDPANLSGANGTNQAVIFLGNAAALHNGTLSPVKVTFAGTGGGTTTSGKKVFISAGCEGAGGFCSSTVTLPNQTGPNRIEFDLVIGASGTGALRYWVNNASDTGMTDAIPLGTIPVTGGNAGWVGVETAFLGMTSPSTNYRTANSGLSAFFDQFDSRRQTFIGH
ncbi:MAG: hypothetical protein ABJA60_07135, partial [Nitrosospira sp.]